MIPVIIACIYGVAAACVCVFMAHFTNKQLRVCHPDDIENENVKPYTLGTAFWIVCAAISAVSAAAGYMIATKVVSPVAIVELSICYFAALAAAIMDYKTKMIPNIIPVTLVLGRVVIFIYELVFTDSAVGYFISSLVGALLCILLLVIANKMSHGGIGGGDIKLLGSIGFVCGLYVVMSSLLLALISCIAVSGLMLALKKCSAKDHVPFGPFIYMGYLIMCLLTLY